MLIISIGFVMPQRLINPVEGATRTSYNAASFWYYPWGKSVTHKGVDIFADEETRLKSATAGLVIYTGYLSMGGNVVLILGPRWRLHYYAHLEEIDATLFSWKSRNERIGTVGSTGNAKGKPAHLHYAIITLIPYPWRIDLSKQGWKKMFYLNPIEYIEGV